MRLPHHPSSQHTDRLKIVLEGPERIRCSPGELDNLWINFNQLAGSSGVLEKATEVKSGNRSGRQKYDRSSNTLDLPIIPITVFKLIHTLF